MTIGQIIKRQRRRHHLSQAELARLADTTPMTISRLEHLTDFHCNLDTLRLVVKALGLPLWQVIREVENDY